MSTFTGREEVSRIKNEDMLVREMDALIEDIQRVRDECNEDRFNDLRRENIWKKVREMQKIFRKG